MKIQDIKNMSEEEFIKWLDDLKVKYGKGEEVDPEVEDKQIKKIRNVMSLFSGLAIGSIGIEITDLLATNPNAEEFSVKFLICLAAFLGGFLGSRKLIDFFSVACMEIRDEHQEKINIDVKNNLERLSQDELEFLICLQEKKHILQIYNNLETDLYDLSVVNLLKEFEVDSSNKFTDANLDNGHAKTMNKND